jgi:hypothetical protein
VQPLGCNAFFFDNRASARPNGDQRAAIAPSPNERQDEMKTVSYEQQILEETPARAIRFLGAIATNRAIRTAMQQCGYTEEEHAHGWRLLMAASGYRTASFTSAEDDNTRAAIAELDAWDEPGFRRVHAALGRLHPDQDAFVFDRLEPAQGVGAVISVATLLDRLDALESSPDRAATRDADRAAIATLAKRGIDAELRAHLHALLKTAQTAKLPVPSETEVPIADRHKALCDLRAWHKDWAETAHAVIRRRDQLILMGLAKRRTGKDDQGDGSSATTDANSDAAQPQAATI